MKAKRMTNGNLKSQIQTQNRPAPGALSKDWSSPPNVANPQIQNSQTKKRLSKRRQPSAWYPNPIAPQPDTATGQREKNTSPAKTDSDNSDSTSYVKPMPDWLDHLPVFLLPLQPGTKSDRTLCDDELTNIPVCDTGKGAIFNPLVPGIYVLPDCHLCMLLYLYPSGFFLFAKGRGCRLGMCWRVVHNPFYGCISPEMLYCCAAAISIVRGLPCLSFFPPAQRPPGFIPFYPLSSLNPNLLTEIQ